MALFSMFRVYAVVSNLACVAFMAVTIYRAKAVEGRTTLRAVLNGVFSAMRLGAALLIISAVVLGIWGVITSSTDVVVLVGTTCISAGGCILFVRASMWFERVLGDTLEGSLRAHRQGRAKTADEQSATQKIPDDERGEE